MGSIDARGGTTAWRVAFVVGNAAHEREGDRLDNPVNDANAIAGTLEELGFEVVKGVDVDRMGFFEKLYEFEQKACGAEAVLFFYSRPRLAVERRELAERCLAAMQ